MTFNKFEQHLLDTGLVTIENGVAIWHDLSKTLEEAKEWYETEIEG